MSTVSESIDYNINYWKECYLKAQEAGLIARKLLTALMVGEGSFDHTYGQVYTLLLSGPKAFEMAFDLGVVFDERFVFTGAHRRMEDMSKSTDFTATGVLSRLAKIMFDIDQDIDIRVKVSSMPKPDTCIIEAVQETTTKFVTRCAETENIE